MLFLNTSCFLAVVFTAFPLIGYGQVKRTNTPVSAMQKAYVWTFSTRDGAKNQLTQNLTTEFEEILVQNGSIIVLNRTKFASILEQRDMEKSVQELSDLPDSTINALKIIKADMVIFGEVYEEKPTNLARMTVTFQNFDSEIVLKASQDAALDKIGSSIVYRETQIRKLVSKINKAVTGKSKGELGGIWHRNVYKRGFGIEIYPYVYEFLAPGMRLSFQSDRRWGVGIGLLTEQFDGVYVWGGANYDLFNSFDEKWSLLVGPNIGIADFRDFFAFADVKLRYKIFTASFGIGYNNDIGEMMFPISIGFHLPVE